jgi:integrase
MVVFPYNVRTEPPAVSNDLHKSYVLKALQPRREPYWAAPLSRGRFIGFRKIDAERGSWIARLRDDAGHQTYRSLGYASPSFDFDAAKAAALQWFQLKDTGISDQVLTVEDACREYVMDRRREKGDTTAHDADMRFRRTVYDKAFGRRPLAKLRTSHIKAWRDDLGLSPASANRTLIALKAALNLAVTNRQVAAAAVQEWRDVKPLKGAGRRRDLYLDLDQRRALLAAADGSVKDLIKAVAVTGARVGELANATRSQFDARTGSITLNGKTGSRTIPLAPAGVTLFARLSKSKLPAARLLVRDDGKPWAHSDWDELVREAANLAKLPKGVCLYTLRHGFITTALTSGLATLDVARLVGTSVQMIEKHYGHLVASAARERLAKVQLL